MAAAAITAAAAQQAPNPAELAYRANNRGVAWLEQFQYKQAVESFREAVAGDPSLGMARFNLAVALYQDDRKEEAGETFRRVLEMTEGIGSGDYDALLNRAIALVGTGRGKEALALLRSGSVPPSRLRFALEDLRPLAALGVAYAQECVSLIEKALGQ